MKERIVIERDIEYLKELEREREEMFMTFPEYRTEQIPETFDELKELCKDNIEEHGHWFKFDTHKGVYSVHDEFQLKGYGEETKPKFRYTVDLGTDTFFETNNIESLWEIIKNLTK